MSKISKLKFIESTLILAFNTQTLFDTMIGINVIYDFPISRFSTSLATGRPVYRIYFHGIHLDDYMPILHTSIVVDNEKKKRKRTSSDDERKKKR